MVLVYFSRDCVAPFEHNKEDNNVTLEWRDPKFKAVDMFHSNSFDCPIAAINSLFICFDFFFLFQMTSATTCPGSDSKQQWITSTLRRTTTTLHVSHQGLTISFHSSWASREFFIIIIIIVLYIVILYNSFVLLCTVLSTNYKSCYKPRVAATGVLRRQDLSFALKSPKWKSVFQWDKNGRRVCC